MGMQPIGHRANYLVESAILIGLLFGFSYAAKAVDLNPLRPADTSSPRATLQGFVETMDDIYLRMNDIMRGYAASDRLYLSPEERRKQIDTLLNAPKAIQDLDVSDILPVLKNSVSAERVLQLKEILDRIALPAFEDIPDREAMARTSSKRWRLPGTEIDIVLVEQGPRAGEYLVSAETVDRLPEFYDRVKKLPYKPGPANQLAAAYRALSADRASQWLILSLGFLVGALFIFGFYRLARRLATPSEEEPGAGWHALLTPLAIILVTGVFVPLLCTIFRIGGSPRVVIAFVQTSATFLTAAWLSMIGAIILAETIVASEHLRRGSLDSQLIRLGMRFAGIVVAIGFLIRGADELGFPAYSVLAGLGVGGLAVALAARDSLANLLGSMLIMIEKPFRVGHVIRVAGSEGTVEDVGFRSTRIRTPDNSLISIPNNSVVNATVENLSLRVMRRQRFFVQITYDTPRERVEELIAGIKQLIADHPLTNKTNFHVRFNNFSESSLDILVIFHLNVEDYATELKEREEILLQIMDLAKDVAVDFAFPTRTLYVETPLAAAGSESADMPRNAVGAVFGTASVERRASLAPKGVSGGTGWSLV